MSAERQTNDPQPTVAGPAAPLALPVTLRRQLDDFRATVRRVKGIEAICIALFGVLAKLLLPGLGKGFWIVVYLALGWLMVIAVQPIMQSLGLAPLILMAVGGLLYSVGVIFYANKAMRYRRAIWHGHVVVAAAVHWVAVLLAVLK